MTASENELIEIEKGFSTLGEAYHKAHADKECLVAFPEMAKAMSNTDLAATAKSPDRWRDIDIELKGMAEPCNDIVMLTYEAHARRKNGESYAALVSTGYVKRADGWKMMFHSQTPLKGGNTS